jgi:DinB superfamily
MPQLLRALEFDADGFDEPDGDATRLLQFNRDLLEQGLRLVETFERPGAPPFAEPAGAHLRHVIEHDEALLLRPARAPVDYDNRPRDRDLERCTLRARARLRRLQARLAGWQAVDLDQPVVVLTRCGVHGEFELSTVSSVGRELMFIASHTVHHFALLKVACEPLGVCFDLHFGKAPATLRHELTSH